MKAILKRIAAVLAALIGIAGFVIAIEYFAGQPMGLFRGSPPGNLGFSAGKFAPPSWKPNSVSSTVEKNDEKHYIAPLSYIGAGVEAWGKLVAVIKAAPRATVISASGNYIYAEFTSTGMGFVDDVEFALDEKSGVIQARSGSRLGVRDFDVNRKRIEAIRVQLGK